MSQEELVTRGCVELLRQAYALIGCLDPEIYKRAMAISPRGSIGTHVRHILDFFENFLRGIETGFINNNQRERNLRI